MTTTISLDSELAKKLQQGMSGGQIELPFLAVYIWTLNGQSSYKQQGNALYYGGWACKVDDLMSYCQQVGTNVPEGWREVTIGSRDGNDFQAFVHRSVVVAPIGKRVSWIVNGRRMPEYQPGGRRHLQVLCYMGEVKGEGADRAVHSWGPVVLTSKGYQAGYLLEGFNKWNRLTAGIRAKIAPGVPAWCFYLSIGTYGQERKVENVGKPGAQSPITPIVPYLPEKLTEEGIAKLFVGSEIAGRMAELQDQAGEWLNAWASTSPAREASEYADPEEDSFFVDPRYDEYIPF